MGNENGFSLIELIIISILVIIVSFTLIPRLKDTAQLRLPIVARKIAEDIRFARQKGMDTNVPYGVDFLVPDQYWVYRGVTATKATDPLTRGDFDVYLDAEEYAGVTLSSVNFGGDTYVEFDSSGTPSNGGSVTITDGSNSRTISVTAATGMVTY